MSFVSNYTIQDGFGIILGFVFFSAVLIAPGYVLGWLLDLFDFKLRRPFVRFQIALILSIAISPILFFLLLRFFPPGITYAILLIVLTLFFVILYRNRPSFSFLSQHADDPANRYIKYALWVVLGWAILILTTLIELHIGDRLYYNVVAHDFSTRVAIINAITRTGVPPVNPGYFPGHPVYLTYLYYFWYVLCSLIDQLGGTWINARDAMIASVMWCGLALMTTIALYLRLRHPGRGVAIWKSALTGIALIFISGFDILAILLIASAEGVDFLEGDLEHWNEQITAWIGSLSWVPHHVAAMIACLTAVMLLIHAQKQRPGARHKAMIVVGLAFGSAFGLSVFVTIVFIIFWAVWLIFRLIKRDWHATFFMLASGSVAIIVISPFLLDLIGSGSPVSNSLPLTLSVRSFWPVGAFIQDYPRYIRSAIYLIALPLNYLLELGFFFAAGLIWLRLYKKDHWNQSPFILVEFTILAISLLIGSFVRSTVIFSNDIGWRAWLPGQFILLIWGVDVIERFLYNNRVREEQNNRKSQRTSSQLRLFLILGLLTTLLDVVLLRAWPILVDSGAARVPNSFSPDTQLGKRTFASREAYEYINQNFVQDSVIQINPTDRVDRTVGLYANRQVGISVHTAFGISEQELKTRIFAVAKIFEEPDWQIIDQACKENFINALIINDLDHLWKNLATLEKQRVPFYKNQYYAVFACGE